MAKKGCGHTKQKAVRSPVPNSFCSNLFTLTFCRSVIQTAYNGTVRFYGMLCHLCSYDSTEGPLADR